MSDPRHTPTAIEVSRSRGVTVSFEDGETVSVEVNALRQSCPCADCRGRRENDRPVSHGEATIVAAELHGALGVALSWGDGHSTGIHSWELIRELAGRP